MEHVTEPPPGGALLAVGSVAAIAVLVVAAVVLFARLAEGQGAERAGPPSLDEPVPTELAGGYEPGAVPAAVSASRHEPVVGARQLDEVPPDAHTCDFGNDVRWESEPEIEVALLGPDGLFLSLVGEGAPSFPGEVGPERPRERWRVTCQSGWDGRGWTGGGGSMGPADDQFGGGFGGGSSCCDQDGLATANAEVAVPGGAAWALQDRGEWWLAYPVADLPRLPLTWKFAQSRFGSGRPMPTLVLFVDAEGREIAEEWVGH